jgi:hypothetical protein
MNQRETMSDFETIIRFGFFFLKTEHAIGFLVLFMCGIITRVKIHVLKTND